ncbi:hypothetical protein BCR44DRAFT_1494089 [Catenaria anguillulae PL171]|uniref:Calcium-transporting ATPase n=1 Tax=Catenaria anguillulae PL171 TaxID=765915 RepID=A0A1Y2H6V2_9FUNG|nr:hypothetical protein BCR44DRAFT_1494089 [Catenaria anguillulae PL171]
MSNNGPASSAADFAITADQLGNVVNFDERANTEQTKLLNAKYGGVDGLAYFLRTHLETGLEVTDPTTMDAVDAIPRQEAFGVNLVPPPPSQTILEMIIENIKEDPIIKILILGAIVTLIIGGIQGDGWVEGIAILSAVAIVLTVTAGNDYSKDKKFKRLLLLQSDKKTKVIRGGRKDQISSWDVMVGDLVELVIGDEIPADGVLVRGNRLVVDESPLTGESIPVKKSAKSPFLFSGCQASEGTGIMLVTAVGARSSGGKIQALLSEAQGQETVLQSKLRGMALSIGKMGFMAGITTFWFSQFASSSIPVAHYPQGGFPSSDLIRLLRFFNTSVTIVVVCVPEGLPLAVTISLAFSMFKMIKDRCFVRHLEASETMGEATAICTDKTGTLTENRMTVVKTLIARKLIHGEGSGEPDSIPLSASLFSDAIRDVLMEAVCINSTCFIKYKPNDPLPLFVGSATEGALLVMAQKLGYDYDKVRKQTRKVENGEYLFTSDRKRMATLCEPRAALIPGASPPLFRLYVKGASEIILGLCQQQVNSDGMVVPLGGEDREHLFGVIRNWAGDGLRTLALAYRDFDRPLTRAERDDPEHDLVFLGLVGIKDPAGIIVRMVTGDNLLTACKIARECSILNDYGIAMEGPVFRELSIPEKKAVIPKLQVLARSSPADKHTLVSLLKEMGEVVAVTGDGTNDAPALKEADVGFAMGISGTQISMNASDIILLDDNFVSIVQSIKWGRNVLNAVRKFLQFQLSVNVVAICTTIIGAIANDESPLTPVQLLWVNLIMDTFGALALASDVPDPKLLKQKPHRRHDPILTRPMTVYVFTCALYQVVILMTILFHAEQLLYPSFNAAARGISGRRWTMTILFTTFVLMQVVNKVLARQLNFELNFLRGTTKNPLFPLMIFCILFIQTLIVQFAGDFVRTVPLTGNEWGLCIAFALGMIPYQTVIRSCVYFYRLQKTTFSQQTGGKTAANGKSLPEQQPLKQSTILKSSSVARSPADLGE